MHMSDYAARRRLENSYRKITMMQMAGLQHKTFF